MSSCQVRLGPGLNEIIEADAVLQGDPKSSVEVSKYPIEDGSKLSDAVTQQPRTISLTLTFSVSPDRTGLLPSGPTRPEVARRRLLRAGQLGEIVQVVWDGGAYYPAVLTSVSAPRGNNGNAREVTIEVEELTIAESETVKVAKNRLKSGLRHKGKVKDKGPVTTPGTLAAQGAILAATALFGLPAVVYNPGP